MRSVILLSGGLDSATALALALAEGREVYALTVDYGQRHRLEVDRARAIARELRVAGHTVAEHKVVAVPLRELASSALTGEGEVPKERSEAEIGGGVPATYVPGRNTVLLALAVSWAESLGADEVLIGVNAVDYSGYPDCRAEFVNAFAEAARLGTRRGAEGTPITVRAPLIEFSKGEIVSTARRLGVDIELTLSCYDPSADGTPCGTCDSCILREKGLAAGGA